MKRSLGLAGSMALLVACSSSSPNSLVGGSTGSGGTINGGGADGGGGTTGAPGATAGGAASSTTTGSSFIPPPPTQGNGEECEVFKVQAERSAPDMLIVMDASASMVGIGLPGLDDIIDPNFWTGGGDTGVNRWEPAVDAVNSLVGQLEESIQFGLMIFPGGAMGCNEGTLDVPMAVMNAQPIAGALANTMPLAGFTPTSATLARAREVLSMRDPVVVGEGLPLPQYVLLVTDGDPNCVDVTNPTGDEVDTGAQQASIAEIEALAQANVKTYVVGIDTEGSSFSSVLDQMAVAGDTGDTAHRAVVSGNADALVEEFQSITSNAVSCSFVLARNVDPSKLVVFLDGEPAEFGVDWEIEPDMRTVNLLESGCNALQLGATLEAQVVCEEVNII